jgi:2-hydroxychromene-2-carboxylate isomerase
MVAFDGNWYWGIDRIAHLEHDLLARGHRRPNACVGILEYGNADRTQRIPTSAEHRLNIDFFCTFRSPYAYLAAQRCFDLQRSYPVRVQPRLMLPMKMAGFVIPDIKAAYFRFDPAREALRHGIPFGNFCDPFGAGLERAMALSGWADECGRLEPYILSVMRGVWAEGLDLAGESGLRTCVERAGMNWQAAIPNLQDQAWRSSATRNRDELASLGQYAAPTFVMDEYVTWGQDRIPLLEREIQRRLREFPTEDM